MPIEPGGDGQSAGQFPGGRVPVPFGQGGGGVRLVVGEVRRGGQPVDGRSQLAVWVVAEERTEVGRLHDAGAAAGRNQATGAGELMGEVSGQAVRGGPPAHCVTAHNANDSTRAMLGRPSRDQSAERAVDAGVV